MNVQTIMSTKQKEEVTEAAEALNLSVSSFLKLAAKEKINRMTVRPNCQVESAQPADAPVKEVLACQS